MLKADTTDIFIYFQIGTLQEKLGNHENAIKIFDKIIKRDSTYTGAYAEAGKIYYDKLDDIKTAKNYFIMAYLKDLNSYYSSGNVDVLYYLGMIAVSERKKTEAVMYYLDLKSAYKYKDEDIQRTVELYKAIQKMRE